MNKLFDPVFSQESIPVKVVNANVEDGFTMPGLGKMGNVPSTSCQIRQAEGWVPALIDLNTRIVLPTK